MKKRTKKKLGSFFAKLFRFVFKLIFIYPFKAIWWVIKQIYHSIKEVRAKSKENKNKDKKERTKDNKNNSKAETTETVYKKPSSGKIKAEARYDSLKEVKKGLGKFEYFQDKIYQNKSTIGLILGARGTGKSAIGMRILENFKAQTEKKIYALGFKANSLPDWITVINDIEDIENDSVLLIDEGGIEFSSRKSMSDSNTILSEILLIARHKDLSVIFITQNSSNLEVNVIRQSDYLILKPSSLLQKDFERKKIKDIYESVEEEFEELKEELGLTYIYADNYRGFVTNTLPSFWSEKVSKSYSNSGVK